jgi:hypothetical protein
VQQKAGVRQAEAVLLLGPQRNLGR